MQKLLRKAYQGEGRRRPARRPTQTAGGCPTLYPRPTLPPRRGSQCGPPTRQAMQRPYPQEGAGSTFRPRSAAMASRDIVGRDQPPNTHATTGVILPAARASRAPARRPPTWAHEGCEPSQRLAKLGTLGATLDERSAACRSRGRHHEAQLKRIRGSLRLLQ